MSLEFRRDCAGVEGDGLRLDSLRFEVTVEFLREEDVAEFRLGVGDPRTIVLLLLEVIEVHSA